MDRDEVNDAFALVMELHEGVAQTELLHRLEVVLDEIEKQAAIDELTAAIAALPAPDELTLADDEAVADLCYLVKTAMSVHGITDDEISNLDKLLAAEEAIALLKRADAAVKRAETLGIQVAVNFARDIVDQLPEGEARAELAARLVAVEAAIPVGIDVALAEEGDKEINEEFDLLLTIFNKFGGAIPYQEAPGSTVVTSNLDGERLSEEIAYDGAEGEATVSLTLQRRGIHLITVEAIGVR